MGSPSQTVTQVVQMTSSAVMSVFMPLISRRISVGVMIPMRRPSSTTGSLCILLPERILAASATLASGPMVMQSFFMMRESCSSSNFLNMSLRDTMPMSFPSEARITGTPVRLFLTITLMASLRLPGTSTTMGAGVIMSATVFIAFTPSS